VLGTCPRGTTDTPIGASQPHPSCPTLWMAAVSTSKYREAVTCSKSPAFIRRDRKPKNRTYPGGVDAKYMPTPGPSTHLMAVPAVDLNTNQPKNSI
jgi:hypothetical protein